MIRTFCVLLGVYTAAGAVAQEQDQQTGRKKSDELRDPIAILKRADAAAKKVKGVQYDATYKPTGKSAKESAQVSGSAALTGKVDPETRLIEKFRFEITCAMPSGSSFDLTVGSDGKTFFVIDPQTRKVHQGCEKRVVGKRAGWASALVMIEFLHPTPFSDEIHAKKVSLKGTEKVGDEECYKIDVVYRRQPRYAEQSAVWYVSKKDFLPRRVDRTIHRAVGETSTTQLTLSNLKVDPKFEKDTFKATVPEGYEQTDEPAP